MIALYQGKIGDGKTHHVVKHELLPQLAKGRNVYTNIDLGDDEVEYQKVFDENGKPVKRRFVIRTARERFVGNVAKLLGKPYKFIDERFYKFKDNQEIYDLLTLQETSLEFYKLKLHSALIIDEAQMLWDAREFKSTRKPFLTLLEYSRHCDLTPIVFITQNAKRLDTAIVRLTNYFYKIQNLGFFGSAARSRYKFSVHNGLNSPAISSEIKNFDQSIFRLYQSSFVPNEHRKMPIPNFIKYGAIGLVALLIFGFISFKKSFLPAMMSGKPPISVDLKDAPITRPFENSAVAGPRAASPTAPPPGSNLSPTAQKFADLVIQNSTKTAISGSLESLAALAALDEEKPNVWRSGRANDSIERRKLLDEAVKSGKVVFHGW